MTAPIDRNTLLGLIEQVNDLSVQVSEMTAQLAAHDDERWEASAGLAAAGAFIGGMIGIVLVDDGDRPAEVQGLYDSGARYRRAVFSGDMTSHDEARHASEDES